MLIAILYTLVVVFLIVMGYFYHKTHSSEREYCNGYWIFGVIISVIGGIVLIDVLGTSYDTYLDNRSFYTATIEQYRSNVTMYKEYAQIDMTGYTDFRGQGYQKEMSDKIQNLANVIIKYNTSIIEKRIMKKNVIFSWLIIEPDNDMKIIKLVSN